MKFFTDKETELKSYASSNKDKINKEDKKIK